MVEWMIVVTMWADSGDSGATSRRGGFISKEQCEAVLQLDLKASFAGLPAVKGHCIDFPARPAGLPEPQPKKKEGRDA